MRHDSNAIRTADPVRMARQPSNGQAKRTMRVSMDPAVGRETFEQRTEQYLGPLYRAARRLVREPADAEDLVHDTYVKAFQAVSRAELNDDEACRKWLYRVLINTFRDHWRRDRRSPEVSGLALVEDGPAEAAATTPDPERSAIGSEFRADAEEALLALPDDIRVVAVLFFVEGRSHREIAEIASIPEGTAMSRLARGRRLLQDRLAQHGGDAVAHQGGKPGTNHKTKPT